MEGVVFWRGLLWAPLIQVAIMFGGSFISFFVAYGAGDVSIYFPFFSETGAHSPGVCIFSYTLILGTIFGLLTVCFRYAIMKQILEKSGSFQSKLNVIAFCIGLASMLFLAGVAAVPMSTVYWAHLMCAGLHFVLAIVYIFMQTYITYQHLGRQYIWTKVRLGICFSLIVFMVHLIILFPIAHRVWRQNNTKPPAMKMPEDKGFGLLLTSSLFEWVLYADFFLFLLTFLPQFHKCRIIVSVETIDE